MPKGSFISHPNDFQPGRVHSISIYLSVFVYMIQKRHFVPVQVIPVFNSSKIFVLVRKLKTNFVLN